MPEELLRNDLPGNEGTRRPCKVDAGPEEPADSLLSLPQARLDKNDVRGVPDIPKTQVYLGPEYPRVLGAPGPRGITTTQV